MKGGKKVICVTVYFELAFSRLFSSGDVTMSCD